MGHMIHGFIGNADSVKALKQSFDPLAVNVYIEALPQDYCLLYLTDRLVDAVGKKAGTGAGKPVLPMDYLFQGVLSDLASSGIKGDLVYFETDYFGGEGIQHAALLIDGELAEVYHEEPVDVEVSYPERLYHLPINTAVRKIGVVRDPGLDEFDTLGLSNYRHMPEDSDL